MSSTTGAVRADADAEGGAAIVELEPALLCSFALELCRDEEADPPCTPERFLSEL
jgi:hypothetical protein